MSDLGRLAQPPFGPGPANGRFELGPRLGSGAYATVYAARDRALGGAPVALKLLHAEILDDDASVARLEREALLARRVDHPTLVRIHDVVRLHDVPALVMELVDGGSLEGRLKGGRLRTEEALRIARGLLTGLGKLHAEGILHRDVKPSNVLLTAKGEVKLADFGISLLLEEGAARLTRETSPVGTLDYAAPEQLAGREPTVESDLYSFGLVLLDMLTGARRLRDAPHGITAAVRRMRGSAAATRSALRSLPSGLAPVVGRLLQHSPARRFASAEDVQRALDLAAREQRLHPLRVAALLLPLIFVLVPSSWQPTGYELTFQFDDQRSTDGTEKGMLRAFDRQGDERWSLLDVGLRRVVELRTRNGEPNQVAEARDALVDVREPFEIGLRRALDAQELSTVRFWFPELVSLFPDFSPFFKVNLAAIDLDADGGDELIVTLLHEPYEPSITLVYEPRLQRRRAVFAARGHHYPVGVLDDAGDGSPALLLSGYHNVLGWSSSLVALRLEPPVDVPGSPGPLARLPSEAEPPESMVWAALLPPTSCPNRRCVAIDRSDRRIVLRPHSFATLQGPVEMAFDGSLLPRSAHRPIDTSRRWEAYSRLRSAANTEDPSLLEQAVESARASGEEQLERVIEDRRRAAEVKRLVTSGQPSPIPLSSDLDSERAFQIATALHLGGAPEEAVVWYRRALRDADIAEKIGRHAIEILHGLLFALAQQERWDEAQQAIRDYHALRAPYSPPNEWLQTFLDWRRGGSYVVPERRPPDGAVDFERYLWVELRSRDVTPDQLLPEVEAGRERASQGRSAFLALEAELHRRLGHPARARRLAERALELAREGSTRDPFVLVMLPVIERRWREALAEAGSPAPPDTPSTRQTASTPAPSVDDPRPES